MSRHVLLKNWQLYVFVLPAFVYFVVFHYYPMYGVQIAFKHFVATQGIWGSEWAGWQHFDRFFHSFQFWTLMKNTFLISLYQLALFPIPVLIALSMNEIRSERFKRFSQTVTYAPHFISVVVMVGIIVSFTNPSSGLINLLLRAVGLDPVAFIAEPGWFKTVFVLSGTWQNMGWGAIIYLAALAGVNPDLHEAAVVDGASRLQRIWHINLPSILPTIVVLFILEMGSFMAVGFEKIYLMQNPLNLEASEVIQTYVYRSGLLQGQYSFSAAVGLFNSLINLVLLVTFNALAKKTTSMSLW